MAFRDVNPQAPVHILVIPKKHIERLSQVTEADMPLIVDIHRAIQKIAQQEKLIEKGYRILNNEGKEAGQTVFHLHYHILGGRPMSWPPG